jgi:hypothetical protein
MSSDIGVMLSDHLPDQINQLKKIKFQKSRSVAMATIPPKIWSWRGHYSGQNILFFQVKKIKLAVNEGILYFMLVKYMVSFLSTKTILLHNIIFHW